MNQAWLHYLVQNPRFPVRNTPEPDLVPFRTLSQTSSHIARQRYGYFLFWLIFYCYVSSLLLLFYHFALFCFYCFVLYHTHLHTHIPDSSPLYFIYNLFALLNEKKYEKNNYFNIKIGHILYEVSKAKE